MAQTCSRVGNDPAPVSSPPSASATSAMIQADQRERRSSPLHRRPSSSSSSSISPRVPRHLTSISPPCPRRSPRSPAMGQLAYPVAGIQDAGLLYQTTAALHKAALSGLPTSAAALNPYLAYNRMKTASGATTLVPVCKDPYCKDPYCGTDKLSPPLMSPSREKASPPRLHDPAAAAAALALAASLPVAPPMFGGMLPPGYPALPISPYTCSWFGNGEFCGKSFADGETMMLHLRAAHSEAATTAAMYSLPPNPYAALGSQFAAYQAQLAAYVAPPPPHHPLTARYHPYHSAKLSAAPPLSSLYLPYGSLRHAAVP